MKYTLRGGSFEQVGPAVTESFVENTLDTVKTFRGGKIIAFFLLFIVFGTYALFGIGAYFANNMEETVGGLDVNNEYLAFLSGIWYPNIQAFIGLLIIGFMYGYRDSNRMKAHFYYYFFITFFMMFFGIYMFKIMQIMVAYFVLRVIYTVLFIITFIYSLWKGYKNAIHMIYGLKKERSKLVEWFSKQRKSLMPVLVVIGGAYFIYKGSNESIADMEKWIIGSMLDFLPLTMVGANFVFMYYIGVVVRNYYTYKYAEQFRKKFQYTKEEWYGPKHKM